MDIYIRQAVSEDAEAILKLNEAFDDVRATVAHIARHIENNVHLETPFIALIDDCVVGLACLRVLPSLCDEVPYAELTELIVDPDYRRRGVGRELVRYIESEARVKGAKQLSLMTSWRNTDAHSFYHAMGYCLYTINMQRDLATDE
jgi:N-acetylglutamate synthase-like GNAT family acetyltransferase